MLSEDLGVGSSVFDGKTMVTAMRIRIAEVMTSAGLIMVVVVAAAFPLFNQHINISGMVGR